MKTILRPLLLPLSVWSAATSLCANWPAWRGPEANGVTSEQNLPSEWSDSSINSIGDELTNPSLVPSNGELFLRTHKPLWCISGEKTAAAAN